MKKACISKTAAGLTGLLLLLSFAACGGQTCEEAEMPAVNTPPPEEPVLTEITITAGETVLEGVLFDNETARAVSAMLPLTVDLWHPAPGFARAFDLPPDTELRAGWAGLLV